MSLCLVNRVGKEEKRIVAMIMNVFFFFFEPVCIQEQKSYKLCLNFV